MDKNIFKVKLYLRADTEQQLVKKMLKNNAVNMRMYDYKIISHDGAWFAWFWADIKFWKVVR